VNVPLTLKVVRLKEFVLLDFHSRLNALRVSLVGLTYSLSQAAFFFRHALRTSFDFCARDPLGDSIYPLGVASRQTPFLRNLRNPVGISGTIVALTTFMFTHCVISSYRPNPVGKLAHLQDILFL
jgi:hypothetical protein